MERLKFRCDIYPISMAELDIYDSEGNKISETGEVISERNDTINELSLSSVRLVADPDRQLVTGFFSVTSADGDKKELYAVCVGEDIERPYVEMVNEGLDEIKSRGYEVDYSPASMDVIEKISGRQWNTQPGTSRERRALRDIVPSSKVITVGVSGVEEALALSREYAADHSVTVMETETFSTVSDYDLAITIGDYDGIQPLGTTIDKMDAVELDGESDSSEEDSDGKSIVDRILRR